MIVDEVSIILTNLRSEHRIDQDQPVGHRRACICHERLGKASQAMDEIQAALEQHIDELAAPEVYAAVKNDRLRQSTQRDDLVTAFVDVLHGEPCRVPMEGRPHPGLIDANAANALARKLSVIVTDMQSATRDSEGA